MGARTVSLLLALSLSISACAIPIRSSNKLAPADITAHDQIPGLERIPQGKGAIVFIRNHQLYVASVTTVEIILMGEMYPPLNSKDYLVVFAAPGIYRYVVNSRRGAFVGKGIEGSSSHLVEVSGTGPTFIEVGFSEAPVRRNPREAYALISGLSLIGPEEAPAISPAMATALLTEGTWVMPATGETSVPSAMDAVIQTAEMMNAQAAARAQEKRDRQLLQQQGQQQLEAQRRLAAIHQQQQIELEMMQEAELRREQQANDQQSRIKRSEPNSKQQVAQGSEDQRRQQQRENHRVAQREQDEQQRRDEKKRREQADFSSAQCVSHQLLSTSPEAILRISNSCGGQINWSSCIYINGRVARDYPSGTTAPGSVSDIRLLNQKGRGINYRVNHCGGPTCTATSPSSC